MNQDTDAVQDTSRSAPPFLPHDQKCILRDPEREGILRDHKDILRVPK